MGTLKLVVQGKGPLQLTDRDYLAEGGEAKVFIKGHLAYKVFHDAARMPDPAKIREVAALDHPHINRPLDLLLTPAGDPIGYSMEAIDPAASIALPRLFVTDYRDRAGLTPATTATLVGALRDTLAFIHSRGFLVVDANENNILVDTPGHTRPHLIDVLSWQTPTFPATAIMPSIRDPRAKVFSELTDWYAFGILACQLFIGIHPYRGNHPDFAGLPMADRLQARMRAGISVFNARTTYPKSVRDFALIPPDYRDWLRAVFEEGRRLPPPEYAGRPGVVVIHAPQGALASSLFRVVLLGTFPDRIVERRRANGHDLTALANGDLVADHITHPGRRGQVPLVTPLMGRLLFLDRTDTTVSATDPADGRTLTLPLANDRVALLNGVPYALSRDRMVELTVTEGPTPLLAAGSVWDLPAGQTQAFEGMLVINALGMPFLVIPEKSGTCHFVAFPELKGYRLVHAKHQAGVAMLVAQRGGQQDKLVVRFAADYRSRDVRVLADVPTGDLNFAVKPNGVAVHIPEDGRLEVFPRDPASAALKILEDPKISMGMRLCPSGPDILFHTGGDLFSLTMTPAKP
jgi:hypothetical protein